MLAALLACYHLQYLESKVTIVVKECCRQVVARCLCDHARLRGYQQFDLYIEECSMGHLIGSFNWTFAMVSSLTQTHWGLWSGFLWLSSFKNLTHTISSSQLLCSCMCLFSNHLHGSFFVGMHCYQVFVFLHQSGCTNRDFTYAHKLSASCLSVFVSQHCGFHNHHSR